jgi:hypothetical protein
MVFGGPAAFSRDVADPPAPDDPNTLFQYTYYLDGPAVTADDVRSFNDHGAAVLSRAVTAPLTGVDLFSATGSLVWSYAALIGMVGGFTLFEVALLAGAGFLVGARQQQRGLAVLASVGADRGLLSRSVAVGGIVIGGIGALAGIGLGVGAAALYLPLSRDGSTTQYYGFGANPVALGAIALVAILAAWAAAAIPGRAASRFDIVAALRGARRPPRPSRLAPALGAVVMLVGAGIAVLGGVLTLLIPRWHVAAPAEVGWIGPTLIVVGSIVLQLGAILGVPLLLRLASRISGRGASARMATRDLARNSARAVPAVAAVMSTMFVAAFIMAALGGGERQSELNYEYRAPMNSAMVQFANVPVPADLARDIAAELQRTLPTGDARVIRGAPAAMLDFGADGKPVLDGPSMATPRVDAAARCMFVMDASDPEPCRVLGFIDSEGLGAHIVVGDAADLAAVLGRKPSAAALRALADGGAVSLYAEYVEHGRATVDWWTPQQENDGEPYRDGTPERSASLDAVVDAPEHPGAFGIVISSATAERIGLDVQPRVVLAPLESPPTQEQQDRFRGLLAGHPVDGQDAGYLQLEQGPAHFAGDAAWIVLGVAGLLTLAASVIALGLARIDARRDELTLGAVGAPPRTLRGIAFWQALVLAGLGSLIGGAFALVPAAAMAVAGMVAFAPPWPQLVASVVVVPLVIAVVTGLTRRARRQSFVDRTAIG